MQPGVFLLTSLAFLCAAAGSKTLKTEPVEVHGRMIIAFVPPPDVKDAQGHGSIEAAAHLSYAVEDTYKCLQPMRLWSG